MAQFGWSAIFKTAVLTAVATSGVWFVGGLVYYDLYWTKGQEAVETPVSGAEIAVEVGEQLAPQSSAPVAMASPAAVPGATQVGLQAPLPGAMTIPVAGVKATELHDTFADARSGQRVHDAIDIMAPRGTAVVAAAPGTVEKLFWSNLGGNTVYVRSPDRKTIYYYAHLDGYAPGLVEGQQVVAGAPIGQVGFTGNADPFAPHLHFAVMTTAPERKWYQEAIAINPYPLLVGPR